MKRTPSRVAAEAIRELAQEIDEQRREAREQRALLEEVKSLLVQLNDGLEEHRSHTIKQVSDLGARVLRLERAR